MPKKRKAQKIITELRRKLAQQQTAREILQKEKRVKKMPLISVKTERKTEKVFPSFIAADLKKSLFLFLLAISFEFVLYYLLEKGGVTRLTPWLTKLLTISRGRR